MKRINLLPMDTDTTRCAATFPACCGDAPLLPARQAVADTATLCPGAPSLPGSRLEKGSDTAGELLFTVLFLALFALVRLRGKNLPAHLMQALLQRKRAVLLLTEGVLPNLLWYVLSLGLSFASLAAGGSFLLEGEPLTLYTLYLFGALAAYHLLLLGIIRWLGWTFNDKQAVAEGSIHLWAFNISLGLLLAPFTIALFFVQQHAIPFLVASIAVGTALWMLLKIIRWVEILIIHRVSIFYMILYLCALEIAPLLVLYKSVT